MYFEDIIVFSKKGIIYMAHLRHIWTILWAAGVTLKLKKCSFSVEKINYPVYVVRTEQLELSEATTAVVR